MVYRAERQPPGKIRDAIVGHLLANPGPASVSEILEGVNRQLGVPCSASSVRSYLRLNEGTVFYRAGRGQYALPDACPEEASPASLCVPSFTTGRATWFEQDCFQWLASRRAESIHAVVTDPPYGLVEYSEVEQAKLRAGKGGVWRIPPAFDGHQRAPVPRFTTLSAEDVRLLEVFFLRWARALLPVLVPGAHVFVASNPLLSYAVASAVVSAGFQRRGEVVRLVMTMRGGDRPKNAHEEFPDVSVMARSMWEPWLVFRKPLDGRVQDNLRQWGTGGLRRKSAEQPFGDVIVSSPTQPRERALAPHPSLKPQAFLRQIVRAALPLGRGIVLDPFAGSGSTLAAAEALGYESVGIEKDPFYVSVARDAIPELARLTVRD